MRQGSIVNSLKMDKAEPTLRRTWVFPLFQLNFTCFSVTEISLRWTHFFSAFKSVSVVELS